MIFNDNDNDDGNDHDNDDGNDHDNCNDHDNDHDDNNHEGNDHGDGWLSTAVYLFVRCTVITLPKN